MCNLQSRKLFVLRVCSLFVVLFLFYTLPPLALAQTEDEAVFSELVKRYFAAYQAKDTNSLQSFWSEKSPELSSARQSWQKTFADHERIEVKNVEVRKIAREGDEKAIVRVRVEISAVDAKTAKPAAAGFGKWNRTLHFVKEGGKWKLWQFVVSEEELAAALLAAKTEAERERLLSAERELVTAEFVKALHGGGRNQLNRGEYGQALILFTLSQQVAEQQKDKAGLAIALRWIGNVYIAQGNSVQALEYYQRSLKLSEEIGDKANEASSLNNIGLVHSNQGNYTEALMYYQKSLRLSEEMGAKAEMAGALGNIGGVHYRQGNYPQALEYHQKKLKLSEEIGDKANEAGSLNNIGLVHSNQGNYTEALMYYQKSLKLGEEIGNKEVVDSSLHNIGLVYHNQGNYVQALEYYQRSLKLSEEMGAKAGVAISLHNIGRVHKSQGNYPQALEHYQKALKLSEEVGDKAIIAYSLGNIGVVHKSQGNYPQALEYYQKALRLSEEMGAKAGVAYAVLYIGNVYELQGNYPQALEHYQKSLKLSEELEDKVVMAYSLLNIGIVHHDQGDHQAARQFSTRAAALAVHINDPETLWNARTTLGKAYRALNQPEPARQAFADAISTIETMRAQVVGGEQDQQRFFEDKLAPYHQMIDLLVAENNPRDAFPFAERAKSRVLLDALRSGRRDIDKAMTATEQAHEQKLNNEIASLNTQLLNEKQQPQPDSKGLANLQARLDRARLDYEAFQTSLYAAHPDLKAQRGQISPLSVTDAAALLPDAQTAVLEFVVAEEKSFLFVLTRDENSKKGGQTAAAKLNVYPLKIKSKDLTDQVERFRRMIATRDLDFKPAARRLFELLLAPAEQQLKGKNTLCIVPDGALWELPFQALQSTANSYLVEQYAIFYAPSLSVLKEMQQKSQSLKTPAAGRLSSSLLAFGNPALDRQTVERVKSVYRDESLLSLPEAEREVKTLARLYGQTSSKIYIGAAAREETAKSEVGNYRVLHFATHGILDDRNPMYSHLVLAKTDTEGGEDGILEAREILSLNLQADLVVLSACQTARGRVGRGEGMIGMSWALFVAGSPATLVSQWKIESSSTTELMIEFHRQLYSKKAGGQRSSFKKAEALRQAALKMLRREEYRHPAYWAGFVLIGDGR